jgi:hypothetical protein
MSTALMTSAFTAQASFSNKQLLAAAAGPAACASAARRARVHFALVMRIPPRAATASRLPGPPPSSFVARDSRRCLPCETSRGQTHLTQRT